MQVRIGGRVMAFSGYGYRITKREVKGAQFVMVVCCQG